jgi:hypothetical protein
MAPDQHHWFAWPSQRDELVGFCLSNYTSDLYTVPALFRTRSNRRAENIAHQWVVYADADSLDLRRLKVEPTMIVETSKDRHHVYWSTGVDDPQGLCAIGRSIAHAHGDQGCDKGGWDAGQLLRIPGSTNNKYRMQGVEPFDVDLKRNGPPVTVEELTDAYPHIVPEIPTGVGGTMPSIAEWKYGTAVAQDVAEVKANAPHIEELAIKPITPKTDRSNMMWLLLSEMARCEVNPTTALAIAWVAPCNKYRLDGRTPEELWHELCRAYADPQNKPVTSSFEALTRRSGEELVEAIGALPTNPENKAQAMLADFSILTAAEREKMPTDTFVDHYVTWAKGRTDAPECYHRAGAVSVLTTIFGQYGMCPTRFPLNLTLWFMILGPTTRARKTTAMNLWVDLVADLETDGHSYLLGSNVTAEALAKVLPRRDGKTSVFYRDEVHGMFDEQEKKRYMAGLREFMTDLYTGNVPITLRAGNISDDEEEEEKKPTPKGRTKTNFVMFLCGTIQQVTTSLTVADYQSGHLARFLAVEADPPPLTQDRVRTEQHRGGHGKDDVRRRNLTIDLQMARDAWHDKTDGGRVKEEIFFEDDAWDRLQDAIWYLLDKAQTDKTLAELLTPTAQRMGMSMMKTAILIAMADAKEIVTMRHVLKAIELAEEWYTTTAIIAGKVVSSVWAARQEEMILKIRARTDGITEDEIYSHFRSRYNGSEIAHDLEILLKANEIMKINEKNGRIRYLVTKRS